MKVAVVLLNWNGRKLLEQFLPALTRHTIDADLWVIDNASTDDSIDFIKNHYPSIGVVSLDQNYGFAAGYNKGLAHIDTDLYALVNTDIEVTAGWLAPVVSHFEKHPKTVAAQPHILDFKNKACFEYAGAAGGFIDRYGFAFCRGRVFDHIEKDEGQFDADAKIFWASGACFFVRALDFKEQKGFDSDFFAHQEEIDLCWRFQNQGHQIYSIGASKVYHLGGATLAPSPRKTFLNFRNSLFMLVKNLPKKQLISVLFMRLVFDGIAGIHFLLRGKPVHCSTIIKAHWHFYRAFRKMFVKRSKRSLSQYHSTKSVVIKYFIHKKKKYKDIVSF